MTVTAIDTTPLIRLKDINYTYPGSSNQVLCDASLEIKKGERLVIIAPNGSAKTTLFHTIMGLCIPDSETMEIFGQRVSKEKDFMAVRSTIGLLFQDADDQLFCPTVIEDVAFGPLNLGCSKKESLAVAKEILEKLGIGSLTEKVTHRLSGGQKRLVALASVLAMRPEMLLLDEPTSGLDISVKQNLIKILTGLEIGYMVISHEFDFLNAVSDTFLSMEGGKIIPSEELHIHQHEHMHRLGKQPHKHI